MIAIVDYKKGNIKSVERAFVRSGADVIVTDQPSEVAMCDAIVLPGVGAFTDAMETLSSCGLAEQIMHDVKVGKPFLGICLGQHLMYEAGVEHAHSDIPTQGLGIIPGTVEAIPREDAQGARYKVPHVGWNTIEPTDTGAGFARCPLLEGIEPGSFFYFTHSYAVPCSGADIAHTRHSVPFPSVVGAGCAYGVQFHPEKSSEAGARLIENFVHIVSEV